MDISVFTDKSKQPAENDARQALKENYPQWKEIKNFVLEKYPQAIEEWNFPGKNYGWSFRMKDKKRAIIYLLPRDGFFKVAFVFGQKALDHILTRNISENIKEDLINAKVYAEGRGVKINVKDNSNLPDIKTLVEIKLAF